MPTGPGLSGKPEALEVQCWDWLASHLSSLLPVAGATSGGSPT